MKSAFMFLLAFATPTASFTAMYAIRDRLALLYDANVVATLRRSHEAFGTSEFARNRVWLLRQLWELAPEIEIAVVALFRSGRACRALCGTWFVLALFSVIAAGEYYERQFVVLVPPVAVAAGIGLGLLVTAVRSRAHKRAAISFVLFTSFAAHDYHEAALTVSYVVHRTIEGNSDWRRDESDDVYACLRKEAMDGSTLFLLEQSPFLYTRLGKSSPTRFPYSDHLLDPRLSYMAGIDADAVIRDVFAQRPRFVVTSMLQDYRYEPKRVLLIQRLLHRYRVTCRGTNYRVYELRSPS